MYVHIQIGMGTFKLTKSINIFNRIQNKLNYYSNL